MKITLAFDVYGTLVDPSGFAKHLAHYLGIQAADFANLRTEKQLECAKGAYRRPPVARISSPVSHADSSDARKTAIGAISPT